MEPQKVPFISKDLLKSLRTYYYVLSIIRKSINGFLYFNQVKENFHIT